MPSPRDVKEPILSASPLCSPEAFEVPLSGRPIPVKAVVISFVTSEVPRSDIICALKISAVIGSFSKERLVPVSDEVLSAW